MPDSFKTIVVGTDGSPSATLAVDAAIGLAARLGATLHVVCAYDAQPSGQTRDELRQAPDDVRWSLMPKRVSESVVRAAAEKAAAVDVAVLPHASPGDPAEILLDVAGEEHADVIVVGNRGMASVQRFLLGSVPNKISHHAPCSVLIVRTT